MNYKKLYENIINNRKQNIFNGYTETHHIIPKSLGGTDNKENLVDLSAREHFICHLLLTKMYPEGSLEWVKMTKAFMCMMFRQSNNQERYINSHWYSFYREKFSDIQKFNQSGKRNSQYGKCWIYNESLKQSKSIAKEELENYLNNGWLRGRVTDWKKFDNYNHFKKESLKIKLEKQKNKQELYYKYFKIYTQYGWDKFKELTGYSYSKANLVMLLQRNIPEFKPQNGKKRGQ